MADVKNDYSTGLVSYWELEETSGTRVDVHGSNDLTDNNTVLQGTGIQGNCADFESTNTEYLSKTSPVNLDLSTYSISLWFKPESAVTGCIIGKMTSDSNINFMIYTVGGILYMRHTVGGTIYDAVGTTTLTNGTWYHIIATFDTTNGSILYLNNVQEATNTAFSATDTATGAMLTIGARYRTTLDIPQDGLIDEVAIYNTLISSTYRSGLYNSGAGIPYEASTGGTTNPAFLMNFM